VSPDATQTGPINPTRLGRYEILKKLGEGGMGAVYLGRDTKLDRQVAIKVLPPESVHDPQAVARFQREAKALAKLAHPGIIQAYDSEQENGQHFLVMEYVEGTSLAVLLQEKGHLPPTLASDYIHQAALALQHAHDKGLVHRDIKPSNLLLTADRRIKVLDLGLARFLQDQITDPSRTREGMGMGTPDYAAPEQFRDAHKAGVPADIYALGCTLYHLVTGQVPFPGSSLTEKYEAHERKEPAPFDELCPEAPAGLALVVQRMMAKRPADRFQTAQQVAEALAPYMATASASFARLKHTTNWHGSQLTMIAIPARPRRRWGIIAGAVAAAAVILAVILSWPRLFPTRTQRTEADSVAARDKQEQGKQDAREQGKPQAPEPVDANVLTVAQDGTGRFKTITAALAESKPGNIIRVLDAATYEESPAVTRPDLHARITLEAPQHATLVGKAGPRPGLLIFNVPSVTVRGFRVRAAPGVEYLVGVGGRSPGTLLEHLNIEPGSEVNFIGIAMDQLNLGPEAPPVIVQNCTMRGGTLGIRVRGMSPDFKTPQPCNRIIVRNNVFSDVEFGIVLAGLIRQTHIVGNRLQDCPRAALDVEYLFEGSQSILFANNTIFHSDVAFRLIDTKVHGQQIQLSNNLVLGATKPDFQYYEGTGVPDDIKGPGDIAALRRSWQLDHNGREVQVPTGVDVQDKSWIPPSPTDLREDRIDLLSRDATRPDFLRPAKDSKLATAGAGKDDPALPRYVGAVPPVGVEPWDWQKTWDARHPKMVLTVSKDPKDGADFRGINDALAKVDRPDMTIRILDAATYVEAVAIQQRHQQGLTLEAVRGATLMVPPNARCGLGIGPVPRITVRGLRLRTDQKDAVPCAILGRAPGVLLDDLNFGSTSFNTAVGLLINRAPLAAGDAPIIVQKCTFLNLETAINIMGMDNAKKPTPSSRIVIRNNKVLHCYGGIGLHGELREVHVVGNQLADTAYGLGLVDLLAGSSSLLVANNSVAADRECLSVRDPGGIIRAVVICNNLLLADQGPGLVFSGKDQAVLADWQIDHNWRRVRSPLPTDAETKKRWLLRDGNPLVDTIPLQSLDPQEAGFFRPPKESKLAKAGAGKDLPSYVGAVPPEGVTPWDWEKTWRAYVPKP
jgi:predicted Ser/Thr protein kinase